MHETVKTVFIDIGTGEEVKELPSVFDRDALKPKLVLSTHIAWKDIWRHYKVVKVEEQAGDTLVAHVRLMRRHRQFFVLILLCVLTAAAIGAAAYFFMNYSTGAG